MKICRKCNIEKELSEFYKTGKNIRNICRKCENISRATRGYNPREITEDEKEKRKITAKQYRKNPVNRAKVIITDSKYIDKRKGLKCELTTELVEKLIANGCSYCGEQHIKMTLDRIDIEVGHIEGNVIGACYRCNIIRGSMPFAAWMRLVPTITQIRERGLFGDWIGGINFK